MNVLGHIKEMISPGAADAGRLWAEQWFATPQQMVATGVSESVMAHGGGDLKQLTPAARLVEDLQLNELQRVQLMLAVEQRFNLEISDRDAEGILTIQQLVDWVESKAPRAPATQTPEA
jgi:acyl carrier protein